MNLEDFLEEERRRSRNLRTGLLAIGITAAVFLLVGAAVYLLNSSPKAIIILPRNQGDDPSRLGYSDLIRILRKHGMRVDSQDMPTSGGYAPNMVTVFRFPPGNDLVIVEICSSPESAQAGMRSHRDNLELVNDAKVMSDQFLVWKYVLFRPYLGERVNPEILRKIKSSLDAG